MTTKSKILSSVIIIMLMGLLLTVVGGETDLFKYSMLNPDISAHKAELMNVNSPGSGSAPKFDRSASSTAGPFLSSLLIPGWGQYKQGRKNTAVMFIGFEVAMWGGIFLTQTYGNSLEDDYIAYAVSHAGISSVGKNHEYYVDIGNYSSQSEFNEVQQKERDYESLYIGEEYYWNWDSNNNRNHFEDLRIKSDSYKHSAIYFAGAIVINHLVSAVEAARYQRKHDSIHAGVGFNSQGNAMLTIIKGF